MGLNTFSSRLNRGISNAKNFLGNAYRGVSKFAGHLDRYAGVIRDTVGAVAPIAGSLTGPLGSAVGTGLGVAMRGLSAYDALKSEAMNQVNQAQNVARAAQRGIR